MEGFVFGITGTLRTHARHCAAAGRTAAGNIGGLVNGGLPLIQEAC